MLSIRLLTSSNASVASILRSENKSYNYRIHKKMSDTFIIKQMIGEDSWKKMGNMHYFEINELINNVIFASFVACIFKRDANDNGI